MGWIVACCAMACALVVVIAGYERDLSRLARWLREREQSSNERVATDSLSPGVRAVAGAIDGHLGGEKTAHEQEFLERKAFKSDLASLSHDLRTPLAGAAGYLELYETRADPTDRERCVRVARERLGAMQSLVDNLFAYSTALEEVDRMSLQPVELFPLVARVLLGLYPAFEERGWEPVVHFEDESLVVRGDPEALQRVFSNLAANALRHGAGAPRVTQAGSRITFANPVEQPQTVDVDRLFDRFYQRDPARRGGGSGLGLAIVAQLCAAMGMRVGAQLVGAELQVWVEVPLVER